MRTCDRILVAMALALTLLFAFTVTAVASDDDSVTVLAGTAPDSLDPQVGITAQANEADWLVYTPLLTYQHVAGAAGGQLIPGLATALPTVSVDGLTYQLTLRKGLRYSNGQVVKASDFAYAIMRAIRLNWGGKSFFTNDIAGAAGFDAGTTDSISGIAADDVSGQIKIRLNQPDGAFPNLLAFPAAGLVPSGTPIADLGTAPPPGVGPYRIASVGSDGGYVLKNSPKFPNFGIPGIPTGHVDTVRVKIAPDNTTEAQQVLNNQADVFDGGDDVPATLLPQILQQASSRFTLLPTASTFYFFLNTSRAPFDNLLARQAVNTAIDRKLLSQLAGGTIAPSCYFLPEGIVGHPTAPCPYGDTPDIAKAQQLVQDSGLAGTPVTVWGQQRSPRHEFADYFTSMLNQIGFDATEHIVSDDSYFTEIGDASNDPQTGFSDWFQDFPNPSDFYQLMDARSIQPTSNENLSKVDDPFIQDQLALLEPIPSTQLGSVADQWQALDTYVAQQAYIAAFGEQLVPKFYSSRIDYGKAVFHVLYGNDFSTLQFK